MKFRCPVCSREVEFDDSKVMVMVLCRCGFYMEKVEDDSEIVSHKINNIYNSKLNEVVTNE